MSKNMGMPIDSEALGILDDFGRDFAHGFIYHAAELQAAETGETTIEVEHVRQVIEKFKECLLRQDLPEPVRSKIESLGAAT